MKIGLGVGSVELSISIWNRFAHGRLWPKWIKQPVSVMSTRKVQKKMKASYFLAICIIRNKKRGRVTPGLKTQTSLIKLFSAPNHKLIELVTWLTFWTTCLYNVHHKCLSQKLNACKMNIGCFLVNCNYICKIFELFLIILHKKVVKIENSN